MSSEQEVAWGQERRAWWGIPQRKINLAKIYQRLRRNTGQRLECCKKSIELYGEHARFPNKMRQTGIKVPRSLDQSGKMPNPPRNRWNSPRSAWRKGITAEIIMPSFLPFYILLRLQALRNEACAAAGAADTQEYIDCSRKAGEERQNWVGIYRLL